MPTELQERSRLYFALFDALLFLYLLFSYEWSPGPGLSSSVGESPGALIIVPIYYALISARFTLAVLFFTCLGGSIYMSCFYEGRWPRWFKLSCLFSFTIALALLLYQWGLTVWRLPQNFPSDLPRGLRDLFITALFSDCGGRLRNSDTALSIGQSTGMYLLQWLAAIYLVEKYFRLAVFHERRDEHGPARWTRFVPVVPILLIAAFVGWGLWGDFQREKIIAQTELMEIAVLAPRETPYWHTAVEQCAVEGSEWRLPTMRELHVLSSGDLGKDSRLGAAWSGEVHAKGGPEGLRWTGERHSRPNYMPDVMHRCLSPHPTDLYQRLIVSLYPELYQQNRSDSFYRYFYPHEVFSVYGGLSGGRPEAVVCVKPDPLETPESISLQLASNVKFVADERTAVVMLEMLCSGNEYEPTYCHRSLVHRYTEIDRLGEEDPQDALAVEQRFQSRLEECRLTAEPSTCHGHGGIYLARGEYARARLFTEEACKKAEVPYTSCVHGLELDEQEAAFNSVVDDLKNAGFVVQKPTRHHEAREPLQQACQVGRAQSCGYLAHVLYQQNRYLKARKYYDKGCSLNDLWACTNVVLLNIEKQTTEQATQKLVDLCHRGESFACNTVASWKLSKKEPEVQQALDLAIHACALGSRLGCANEAGIRNLGSARGVEELDPDSIRSSTPHDIKNFRSDCVQNDNHCLGYVDRLALQGQFRDVEWFKEQVCIGKHLYSKDLKECTERIPGKGLFESMTDALMTKQYIKERPGDHASLVPVLKKACQDGMGHACWYLGKLMYDAMTGRWADFHPVYSQNGLLAPFKRACDLGMVLACSTAQDITREFAEGRYAARLQR